MSYNFAEKWDVNAVFYDGRARGGERAWLSSNSTYGSATEEADH